MSSLYEEVKCAFCGAALSTAGLCPNQYQHTRQRLDAEAATAEGCSRCGFMALTGHDCPELDVPPDAAVPWRHRPTLSLASSAALAEDGLDYLSRQQAASANPAACADAILCARAHIAALTAERDALLALVGQMAAFVKDVHEFRLDDETDYTDRSLPFNVCDYYHMEDLMKEAARFTSASGAGGEGAHE